ncbi:hypothetical protein Mp_7g17010 [Marchantia polymorpha subsp. ruderalis]|uniref:Uncharacterized protein n=2 Tax=Marchantia polymorpha TaxID=3197 RepID=A0AAF6C0M5_MARPO|nr:hypothetical protein MARPO_0051s0039 [Marchantia polymorpha]BBN17809.1 hypothetical protein Mp_7g17010 [Marchantia polymorpha subsp. ruderalis]|eukprot:PTQ38435.1 hypothetical protein MARPO_0051s0039 [Marchantia polymorpha]
MDSKRTFERASERRRRAEEQAKEGILKVAHWGSATSQQLQPTNERDRTVLSRPPLDETSPAPKHHFSSVPRDVDVLDTPGDALQCNAMRCKRALITTPSHTPTSIHPSIRMCHFLVPSPCLLSRNICPAHMIFSPFPHRDKRIAQQMTPGLDCAGHLSIHAHEARPLSPLFPSKR